ncbi:iron-siderophore ABC transporter substrate-binding protein [Paenibacillus sp. HB172176]|uniref:ABC transporter substrate-binding protein n=1 Tax=Paenibacillus sp. HB172176 TaxID=2493690 RepID=UPI0014397B9B|nr:iron-siderophore ABC transporter substrate-binding protein [Paenibacillus sp. HB172176]
MRKMKTQGLVWLLAAMLVLAAGCGQSNGNANEGINATAAGNAAGSEENKGASNSAAGGEGNETRVIEHAMGSTELKGIPQKVVTLYQGANDTAVAYGIKPVGIVESWSEKPIYSYLRDDLEGIPMLGEEHQPNLEALSQLKPDLIVGTKTRHEAIYDQLSQIAPTVMIDQVYDWKATVKLMGEALHQEEKADQLMQDWDDRVADFKTKMGDRLPIEATITNFRADHARIFYMGFGGGILKEAGFDRPEGHDADIWGVTLTSKESIPDMNADVIFNFNTGTDEEAVQRFYEDWTTHPLWKSLDAVKNGQVYDVNEVAWNSGGGYLAANNMLDQLYEFFNLAP